MELARKERSRTALAVSDPACLQHWDTLGRDHFEPLPLFPFSKTGQRVLLKEYKTITVEMELAPSLTDLVSHVASKLSVTPFHVHLSTLAMFFAKCLDLDTFNIGMLDATRADADDTETAGHFVNSIPLRFDIDKQEPFSAIARRTRDNVLSAMANSLPFDMILDHLGVSRSTSHHPLFQAVLNFRHGYTSRSPLGADGEIEWETGLDMAIVARNPYDIAVDVSDIKGRTLLHWTTQEYMYSAQDATLMMDWYIRALERVCWQTEVSVSQLSISNATALSHALNIGKGSSMDLDPEWQTTLVDRIDTMACQYLKFMALVDGYGTRLTYHEMLDRSLRITHLLVQEVPDLASGQYVGVLLDPSADQVCTLLAILRLGLVYVPLDLRNPIGRLSKMLQDCRPQILIYNDSTKDRLRHLDSILPSRCISLGTDQSRCHLGMSSMDHAPFQVKNPDQPAVILYTSGSTGIPKGVVLSHANILQHTYAATALHSIGHNDVMLQQSSLGFDLSLDQTFNALANGGTLVIVSPSGRGDPLHIARLILSEKVTYTNFVNSEYLSLLNHSSEILSRCSSWRLATQLGEKLTPQLRAAFRTLALPGLRLSNAYGPTEATISCARGIVPFETDDDVNSQSDSLWPMPNYSLIVVDAQMNVVPIGFPGEICICGSGVALGYHKRAEETADRFVDLDTTEITAGRQSNIRTYRTGDHGRLMEDGSLQVFGRFAGDGQVKIRGYRVELDEISAVILHAAGGAVANAALSYRVDKDEELFIAFVMLDAHFTGDKTELVDDLRLNLPLPGHMCPSIFVQVEHIPVNVNGKKDQRAVDNLPIYRENILGAAAAQVHGLPFSGSELQVKGVWEDVLPAQSMLGPERIQRHSDFFRVGGNSLLAIQLRSRLRAHFGVDLPLPKLFQHSTLSGMADCLQMICGEIHVGPQPTRLIDWDTELSSLASGLSAPCLEVPLKANGSVETHDTRTNGTQPRGLVVLLTGATGFLGTKVLRLLAADPRVRTIHCVAIRPGQHGDERYVAVSSPKVLEYMGGLADERLGLSPVEFQQLSETVDIILHNGASVSYLKSYHTLRGPNVMSTRMLCEMALKRHIPICFVSSAAVAEVRHECEDPNRETGCVQPLPAMSIAYQTPSSRNVGGYALSKWASESVLERVAMEHGVPVCVFRPATIVGEGAPTQDLMTEILNFSRKLGSVPITEGLEVFGSFDLVEVDAVAGDLVEVALSMQGAVNGECSNNSQDLLYFKHYSNPSKVSLNGLDRYLEEIDGYLPTRMPLADWLDAALEKGFNPALYNLLKEVTSGDKRVLLPGIC